MKILVENQTYIMITEMYDKSRGELSLRKIL